MFLKSAPSQAKSAGALHRSAEKVVTALKVGVLLEVEGWGLGLKKCTPLKTKECPLKKDY